MTVTPPPSPSHRALVSANSPLRTRAESAKSSPVRSGPTLENPELAKRIEAAAGAELSKPPERRPNKRGRAEVVDQRPKVLPLAPHLMRGGSFKGPDRLIPDRQIVMRQPGAAVYSTPRLQNPKTEGQLRYEAKLAEALFGSPRNPYEYPILRKASGLGRVAYPAIPMNEVYTNAAERRLDLPGIYPDFYPTLAAYSHPLDCLAIILQQRPFTNPQGARSFGSQVYFYDFVHNRVSSLFPDDALYLNPPISVAFNQRGSHLVLGLDNGAVEVWSLNAAPQRKIFEVNPSSLLGIPAARINCLLVANHKIFAGDQNGKLYLINPKTGHVDEVPNSHEKAICNIVLSPKGKYLATGGNDNKVIIRNAQTLEKVREFRMNAAIKGIAFSPESDDRIAIGGGHNDPRLCIYDLRDPSDKELVEIPLDTQITNLMWENKNRLITTHYDGTYKVVPLSLDSKCPAGAVLSIQTICGRILYAGIRKSGGSQTLVCAGGAEILETFPLPWGKPKRKEEESAFANPFTRIR